MTKPKQEWEIVNKIFDEIIADEENGEMNVSFYRRSYEDRIEKAFASLLLSNNKRLAEKVRGIETLEVAESPTGENIGLFVDRDQVLSIIEKE